MFEFGDRSNTFLTFAIQQGLLLDVGGKLDGQPDLLLREGLKPLLYYALVSLTGDTARYSKNKRPVDMVRILLERGAQPYEKFSQGDILHGTTLTVFALFLRKMYTLGVSGTKNQYRATKMMIEHSSMSHLPWHIPFDDHKGYHKRLAVSDVLKSIFKPDEAARLEAILMEDHSWRIGMRRILSRWTGSSLAYSLDKTIRMHFDLTRWAFQPM